MICPICNDTKVTYTASGVYPCPRCKDKYIESSNKQYKNSHLYCMFDGIRLKELPLGFLRCPKCTSIFLPSQLQGKQILQEVCKESFEEE
jgi:hypothetical protein